MKKIKKIKKQRKIEKNHNKRRIMINAKNLN